MIRKISRRRLQEAAKKTMGSILLSAAVLAIANMDTVNKERAHQAGLEAESAALARERLKARLAVGPSARSSQPPVQDAVSILREALAEDELDSRNPYSALTNLEPLKAVFAQGVVSFQREVFRSPQYQDDSGYDIVAYEIHHSGSSVSKILAYTENPLERPDRRQTVVVVLQAVNGMEKQTVFRDGILQSQNQMTMAQAEAWVQQKLNAGIPFFSVAR